MGGNRGCRVLGDRRDAQHCILGHLLEQLCAHPPADQQRHGHVLILLLVVEVP